MENLSTAKLELRSGGSIPQIGLGAWRVMGPRAREPILSALGIGYRHVDGVYLFAGEAVLGAAMRESGIPREEIFVTLKLWNDSKGYDAALRGFDTALNRGGLEYVDLYLIHRLYGDELRGTWRAIEEIRKSGRARALGTSNYGMYNLGELLVCTDTLPEVNQMEIHPFLQERETRAFCAEHGIVVEASRPSTQDQVELDHPVLASIAKRVGHTPVQVSLRWALQHGLVVLPRSTDSERQKENASLFDFMLDEQAMAEIDALDGEHVTRPE